MKGARKVEKVPKDASIKAIERNIVFLEHGKCPSCKARKHELIADGMLNLYDEMDLVLGQRSGKALALDTPIFTTIGWKTMGDMKIGDTACDMNGNPTKVIAVSEVLHERKCLEVDFDSGESIVCDSEHQWIVEDEHGGRFTKTTRELWDSLLVPQGGGAFLPRWCVPAVPKQRRPSREIVCIQPSRRNVPVKCIQTEAGNYLCGENDDTHAQLGNAWHHAGTLLAAQMAEDAKTTGNDGLAEVHAVGGNALRPDVREGAGIAVPAVP